VEEDVVFKDAIGSANSSVSAYFLIYMSQEFALQAKQFTDYEQFIPPFLNVRDNQKVFHFNSFQTNSLHCFVMLQKEIEVSNKKFIEALENYNKNSDESTVQKFIDLYEKKVQQSIEYASFSLEKDMRVKRYTF
jgi:hypothetical protein